RSLRQLQRSVGRADRDRHHRVHAAVVDGRTDAGRRTAKGIGCTGARVAVAWARRCLIEASAALAGELLERADIEELDGAALHLDESPGLEARQQATDRFKL